MYSIYFKILFFTEYEPKYYDNINRQIEHLELVGALLAKSEMPMVDSMNWAMGIYPYGLRSINLYLGLKPSIEMWPFLFLIS